MTRKQQIKQSQLNAYGGGFEGTMQVQGESNE